MKSGKDFVQGYNAQVVVDEAHQVIVSTGVTNQAPDAQHLPAMVAAVEQNVGARPVQTLGDAGYYSAENTAYCEEIGTDALLSVAREKHVLDGRPSPWPENDPRAAMHARLRSKPGAAVLASTGRELHLIALPDGRLLRRLTGATGGIWRIHTDGENIVAGTNGGELLVWSAVTGELLARWAGHSRRVWAVALSPDGRWLASGGADRSLGVWDLSLLSHSRAQITALARARTGLLVDESLALRPAE